MIKGNAETIKRARDKKSADKSSTINWDALDSLPEEYEAVISEVRFDPQDLKKSFSEIGKDGNWMPKPELLYEIATARGISGGDKTLIDDIIQEVDINRLLAKPIGTPPNMQRRVVGKKVSKFAQVLAEDGSLQKSSVCTIEMNVWERCCADWSAEEVETNGYTVEIKTGKYQQFSKDKWGPHYFKGEYAYPIKFQSPYARQKNLDDEMKFAHAKAETKAHGKAIRELACLPTGYSKDDLKDGVLYFAKIRISAESIKLDAMARRQALANGHKEPMLIESVAQPEMRQAEPAQPEPDFPAPEPIVKPEPIDSRQHFLAIMNQYKSDNKIPPSLTDAAIKTVDWVSATIDAHTNEKHKDWWKKALANLKAIEDTIPVEMGRIEHKLYEVAK